MTVLLELAVDNAAMLRAMSEFLIAYTTGGNEEKIKKAKEHLDHFHSVHRKAMVEHLYERFGDLPDGLLPNED